MRSGALKNMTIEELEQRGAETGLVLILDDVANAEKILPNPTPQGLDRVSFKAEEHIKSISGVSDYQQGQAREDVSAKAVQENLKRGSLSQAKPMDSLVRTDWLLARHVLDMVQSFYTEPRLINITHNKATGEQAQVEVNQPTPEGTVMNDLTVGEYDIVVTSVPHRDTLEQSQFEQAVALREQGVPIPDEVLIEHSALYRKNDILQKIADQANSSEAQHALEIKKLGAELELANLKAEAARVEADATLKQAKARKEATASAIALREAQQGDPAAQKAQIDMQAAQMDMAHQTQKAQMDMQQSEQENALRLEEMQADLEFKRQELEIKREELEIKRQEAILKLEATKAQTAAVGNKAAMDTHAAAAKAAVGFEASGMKLQQTKEAHRMKMQQQKEKRNGGRH
jgi:hypothetical protein